MDRHPLWAAACAAVALWACDNHGSEQLLESGVSDELRAEALEAAARAESQGRPTREAWDRSLGALGPAVPSVCPPAALAAPRRERFVFHRSSRFTTDVPARVIDVLGSAYGYSIPALSHAETIRVLLSRDDAERLRGELSRGAVEPAEEAVVVFVVDTLRTAQRTARRDFDRGRLAGRAYLLDAAHQPVCARLVDSTNSGFLTWTSTPGLDGFDARALMDLFEQTQRHLDEAFDPARADPEAEVPDRDVEP